MELVSFKNMFTVICSILALALIYQVLFSFLVTRPTTTSKEEKELEIADFPEVVVCLNPGLNYEALLKYGYYGNYPHGRLGEQLGTMEKFVGWNGGDHENKSSRDILEEALIVPDSWRFNRTRLILGAGYRTKSGSLCSESEVTPVILSYPLGRCMYIGKVFKVSRVLNAQSFTELPSDICL